MNERYSPLTLPSDVQEFGPARKFRILAISGGGYRGLFAAEVLTKAAERDPAAAEVAVNFDLIAGTSVGGLLAAGLALGRSPAELVRYLRNHGPLIFDQRYRLGSWRLPISKPTGHLGGLLRAKYEQTGLRAAITDVLGKDVNLKIRDVPRPLLLVAVCATTMSPFLMSNVGRLGGDGTLHPDMPLMDALLATSAAPGYFPAVWFDRRSLVDGGLGANAPELLAVAEAIRSGRTTLDTAEILSIGTASPDASQVPRAIKNRGLLRWLATDLVPLTLDAQEKIIARQAEAILGPRYRRINAQPSPDQAEVLALDSATPPATETLLALARDAVVRLKDDEIRRWFVGRA